ncbi:uncharacterized protein PITG_04789 [Phytophthora infestans T30-4]|uniref:PiggyBac transposable element-derived protein domain-containing protein n=1 Tax=Phytophthora infestans (strain T30-4) TaxID=403677 RepID=D0N218_PHYIT|nr:uncharacterized protein PITG_04789 [Phytophthora infestans T30-4]EEY68347.1 hypothetical protein PITG_04789 [Phytophthora infestans T30-4]|eukprot:XP_002905506.1 hypothetical protein PITG_04789 [Phytophthora infestans T30-4]
MKDWFSIGPSRGSFKMLQSKTSKGQPMYALCWADRKPKCIISNRGTSLPGTDSYERRIERPQMGELLFSKISAIDVHNHLRQGCLEMERPWLIKQWHHRCLDSTIANFNSFISQLAHQLIFSSFIMHSLAQYQRLSGAALQAQRKCGVCGKKASFYCVGCSDPLINQFFGVCRLKTNRNCHCAFSLRINPSHTFFYN